SPYLTAMSPVNFFLVLSAFLFSTVAPMQVSTTEMDASCDCPGPTECSACSGNLNSLTLQYIGTVAALVVAEEGGGGGAVFSGVLNTGDVFIVQGTAGQSMFKGQQLIITVGGVEDVNISTTCTDTPVVPHSTLGSFRVVAGESHNGGP